MSKILVTGAAGFIGFHLSQRLIDRGDLVTGFDNLNDYYDVSLKKARLSLLGDRAGFSFVNGDLSDLETVQKLFTENTFDMVINLAAQAGVRYSSTNPELYINSNIVGFINILESCRRNPVRHLVYASSSSVYGANTAMPFSVHQNVDHPLSLYAATKKANELMAHTYSANYGLPTTGLRFFTVYGPWGRPDMSYFLFTKAILEGKSIDVYNNGKMMRDFTYIDDIVEGILMIADRPPLPDPHWNAEKPDPGTSFAPWRLYNIGNNKPVELLYYIEVIEKCLGKTALKNFMPLQAGDVPDTYSDVEDLIKDIGFKPATDIEYGIERFVGWYRDYYKC